MEIGSREKQVGRRFAQSLFRFTVSAVNEEGAKMAAYLGFSEDGEEKEQRQ